MNHVSQTSDSNLPDKIPETVEKDVRKWVESIGEFKADMEMEQMEANAAPVKKPTKKMKKLKTKKKSTVQSAQADENKNQTKSEQKTAKPKAAQKKDTPKEKRPKDGNSPKSMTVYDNLRDQYKNVKLPPNWVSGQSRTRLIFSKVKVVSHGSQSEMVSDRGVAITNDCMVHVFINGPEIVLNNWKMQKVQTIEDIRKTIKAVDGFKICSGAPPNGSKSPSCLVFLGGDSKTCQSCTGTADSSQLKVSGMKVKTNPKLAPKPSTQK